MLRVLVPIKLFSDSNHLIEYAIEFCLELKAEIILFNHLDINSVNTYGRGQAFSHTNELLKSRENYLKREVDRIIRENDVKAKFYVSLFPLENILSEGELRGKIDLILMRAGNSILRKDLWFKLKAQRYLKKNIPILFIPEQAHFRKFNNVSFITDQNAPLRATNSSVCLSKVINDQKTVFSLIHIENGEGKFGKVFRLRTDTLLPIEQKIYESHFLTSNNFKKTLLNFFKVRNYDLIILSMAKKQVWRNLFNRRRLSPSFFGKNLPLFLYYSNP